MDKRSKIFGVLKSKGEFFLNLYYIPYWADIQEGDTLVTGGIGKFPYSGIPIGIVQKIEKKEGETFLEIKVKPLFDPSKFSIFILK
jgi:cell shape-determining protein MreC